MRRTTQIVLSNHLFLKIELEKSGKEALTKKVLEYFFITKKLWPEKNYNMENILPQ